MTTKGRPLKYKSPTVNFTLRLPEDLDLFIRDEAATMGISRAEFIVQALEEFFKPTPDSSGT